MGTCIHVGSSFFMRGQAMKQKEDTSIMSPEMQAFLELVDREAQRVHLLNENNRVTSEKPLTMNRVIWQPSFEMVDFAVPSDGSFKVNSTNGGEERPKEVEEKGPKRALKRPGDSVIDLASLPPKEKIKKTSTSTSDIVLCDAKKEADSLFGAKNWSLWFKS
ncbi:hypothetical protein MRB53_024687 [Persea americana]|uniref:Uncharacterized protein n=1 Tax=Persea americana TaxID=3435 RepID=A0ACC2LEA7_PERAE|nr:hypothetical protein MRB53_024687 [Persea americana]